MEPDEAVSHQFISWNVNFYFRQLFAKTKTKTTSFRLDLNWIVFNVNNIHEFLVTVAVVTKFRSARQSGQNFAVDLFEP